MGGSSSKIFVEHRSNRFICGVRDGIIRVLCTCREITPVDHEELCDVKVILCPIVSRAGTDIEAAFSRLPALDNKPTLMMVLHNTFDTNTVVPNSSRYDRENLMMVDVLFCEDQGLLKCTKNNEAFGKAVHYIKKNASTLPVCWGYFSWIISTLDSFKRPPINASGLLISGLYTGSVICIF